MNQVQESNDSSSKPMFKIYRWRWFVLASYCLFSFSNPFGFVQYAPILKIAAAYFNQPQETILWLPNIYTITYVLFSFFTVHPIGVRLDYSLYFAITNNCVGYWINYIGKTNFNYQILGFIFIGIAQSFLLAAPIFISQQWFGPNERNLAASIGSFSNTLGQLFSFIFPVFFFANISDFKVNEKIEQMNLLAAILGSVSLIFGIIFIRNKPLTPPSYSSAEKQMGFKDSIKQIFKSLKNIMNLNCIAVYLGINWSYESSISLLLEPHGYTQSDIGMIGLIKTVSGILAGIAGSIFLDYQISRHIIPKYDLIIKLFCSLGILALLIQAIIIKIAPISLVMILTVLIGVGFNAYFPIAFQSFAESNYPAFDLSVTTSLMVMANLFCFGGMQLILIEEFQEQALYVLTCFAAPFYFYMMFMYSTELKRLSLDNINAIPPDLQSPA